MHRDTFRMAHEDSSDSSSNNDEDDFEDDFGEYFGEDFPGETSASSNYGDNSLGVNSLTNAIDELLSSDVYDEWVCDQSDDQEENMEDLSDAIEEDGEEWISRDTPTKVPDNLCSSKTSKSSIGVGVMDQRAYHVAHRANRSKCKASFVTTDKRTINGRGIYGTRTCNVVSFNGADRRHSYSSSGNTEHVDTRGVIHKTRSSKEGDRKMTITGTSRTARPKTSIPSARISDRIEVMEYDKDEVRILGANESRLSHDIRSPRSRGSETVRTTTRVRPKTAFHVKTTGHDDIEASYYGDDDENESACLVTNHRRQVQGSKFPNSDFERGKLRVLNY